jgi:hypothetical protein
MCINISNQWVTGMSVRTISGWLLTVAASLLVILVDYPILSDLDHKPVSLRPDPVHRLVIPHNCHGGMCFITPEDAFREKELFVIGPITLVLGAAAAYLLRKH